MSKVKKSGSAIFMDCVIVAAIVIVLTTFFMYYSGRSDSKVVLWIGVAAFTITYHFEGRLIMGKVTERFPIRYDQWWFEEKSFEKQFYHIIRVKKWKGKALTYNPELFKFTNYSAEEIANHMAKAETDHWINELISLSTLLFALIWGELWIFAITCVLAMLFDAQFIAIQRYNRPRMKRLIKKEKERTEKLA